MTQSSITLAKYIEMVEQALFELKNLRESVEYEEEGIMLNLGFIDGLETGLNQLLTALTQGQHRFGGDALPFMTLVSNQKSHVLPFKRLLEEINYLHCQSLVQEA